MKSNYREGDFDLKASGGQDGSFNDPRDGKAQALLLVLGFFTCHLFGLSFRFDGHLSSIVGVV